MQITNINFISNLTEIENLLATKDSSFFNVLCNFLVDKFGLSSSLLFRILPNKKLLLLGKSITAKKNYVINSLYSCSSCKLKDSDAAHKDIHSDINCDLKSSDFLLYETCVLLKPSNHEDQFLLKIAQKTPFTQLERESIEIIADYLVIIINAFYNSGSGSSSSITYANEVNTFVTSELNSLSGSISMLDNKNLLPSQKEYIDLIYQHSNALKNSIFELIFMLKGEQTNTELSGVDFHKFFDEALNSVKQKNKSKKLTYSFNTSNSEGKFVKVPKENFVLLIDSLLFFLFSQDDVVRAEIDIVYKEDTVNVKIIDRTLVLSPQVVSYFNEATSATTHFTKINNLSPITIPVIKKIAEGFNAIISINSDKSSGTIITFVFKPEYISSVETQISSLPKATEHNNKILVIEDDYATSRLLSNYLYKWNYEPTVVNSGEKALDIIQEHQFLAIITDVVLPDINGLELIQKIRTFKNTRSTPIIVCTIEAEKQKAFMMGPVEYFVKPIKYKDLVEVLTNYKLRKDSKVLCVDDDLPTLSLVKEAIESAGYTPVATHKSVEVMKLIENVELDLAIVDLDMPQINGFELIKLIKSNPRFANLPIIIYTGKENFDEDLKQLDGLFTDLLSKRSTNVEDLAKVINNMINRYDEPTRPEEAAKEKDTPKILLVEDYKHSQIIVTRLLKKNGFTTVVVVENGAEAIEQVKKQKFDLILMDMQMPVMNGFEATEMIRKMSDYKETPIIALTAFAMKGDKEKCIDAGATDYIPKPIDSQEFIEKVKFYTTK